MLYLALLLTAASPAVLRALTPSLLAAGLTTGADAPAVWGDRLYFAAQDEAHGSELWVSDGTAGGTALVKDLAPGTEGSSPTGFTPWLDQAVFHTWDRGGGKLWRTDGTFSGTVQLYDLAPGSGFGWNGNTNDIVNAFNNGRFLITHRDHGSARGPASKTGANATVIFVPPPFCADAILEAADAGVALAVLVRVVEHGPADHGHHGRVVTGQAEITYIICK